MHGHRMLRRLLVCFCGLAILLVASQARAQVYAESPGLSAARTAHAARLAANPESLSLQVRTQIGRVQFAQGEMITLNLEFRDTSGTRYDFDARGYDRSGRLGIDRLIVAPIADVEDPLRDYYGAMGFGFIGGGLSTPPAPLVGARALSLDVNEWVRSVRPGTYAAYVQSQRFLDREPAVTGRHATALVVSNLLCSRSCPRSVTRRCPRRSRHARCALRTAGGRSGAAMKRGPPAGAAARAYASAVTSRDPQTAQFVSPRVTGQPPPHPWCRSCA